MVGESPWTSDQLAALLGCHRNHTSRRIQRFTRAVEKVLLERPEKLAASGRPDRVTEAVIFIIRTGGRLAEGDPDRLREFVRTLAEERCRENR